MNLFRRKKTLIRQTQATEKPTDRQRQALQELPENYLADIARNADMRHVRFDPSPQKLTDQHVLAEIVIGAEYSDSNLAMEMVEQLTDPEALAEVARNAKSRDVLEKVVQKLLDQSFVDEIVEPAENSAVREAALKKLAEMNKTDE